MTAAGAAQRRVTDDGGNEAMTQVLLGLGFCSTATTVALLGVCRAASRADEASIRAHRRFENGEAA